MGSYIRVSYFRKSPYCSAEAKLLAMAARCHKAIALELLAEHSRSMREMFLLFGTQALDPDFRTGSTKHSPCVWTAADGTKHGAQLQPVGWTTCRGLWCWATGVYLDLRAPSLGVHKLGLRFKEFVSTSTLLLMI